MSKMQLGVIFGSRTCEHEVSIISALQLMKAVDREKYDVIPIYISMKGEWFSGDPLLDVKTYNGFDENQKGIFRVQLDLTAGSGALTTIEPAKGLFGQEKQRLVARLDCVVPRDAWHAWRRRHASGLFGNVQYSLHELGCGRVRCRDG